MGVLLLVAGGFTLLGTIVDLIKGSDSRAIADSGLFLLDRVLLLFIIAELLYTLRLVDVGGQILVEPFLFIGVIAVVRRILVIAAELEGADTDDALHNFLIEVGALAGLAFVLVLSIFLLRRGGPPPA
ncbi:MAG: hypothetical protein QOK00_9 [Thermoleophilaceae bacterium]|nr:hypothetical protein [Thermoleophilaceae bacterium]MEA2399606.1 hypothetical protein [Thermoleophilaceae bacterium]